jgi:hypothetical protein
MYTRVTVLSRKHAENKKCLSMQKIKSVYVSNKNRRVPIELVSLEDAMGTSQEAWCNIITEKSVERMVYMQPVTEALVRNFFFK